jgi:hypothetical protein
LRLSDHIIAEIGQTNDVEGIFANMAKSVRQAERFELSDDVAIAAYRLTQSKPTTLLKALPLTRAPFRKMWFEWRGGASTRTGWIPPENRRDESIAPDPIKQGALVETDETGQRGIMTFAWVHKTKPERVGDVTYSPVNISPLGTLFNWQQDAVIALDAMAALRQRYPTETERIQPAALLDLLLTTRYSRKLSDDDLKKWMERSWFQDWARHAKNPDEREALRELGNHAMPFVSPHGVGFTGWCAGRALTNEKMMNTFLNSVVAQSWEKDIEGESPMIETIIAMMNSRNPPLEHRFVDLTALNKSRTKMKRPTFLPYRTTHLKLSQAQARAFRAGIMTREEAGLHSVRGHFKIRKSGVFWWSPFYRGLPGKEVERKEYVVS